jgi:hypothetical protein
MKKAAGYFYKAVVQSVLLDGCETWTLTKQSLNALEGFHTQVAHKLARQSIHSDPLTGKWLYPPAETVHSTAGLFTIHTYIQQHRTYLQQMTAKCPLYNACRFLNGGAGMLADPSTDIGGTPPY